MGPNNAQAVVGSVGIICSLIAGIYFSSILPTFIICLFTSLIVIEIR